MLKFLGTTLIAAVVTPFSPLFVLYALFHSIRQTGNGADLWATLIFAAVGVIGIIGYAILVPLLTTANLPLFGICYLFWCLSMGLLFGTD